MGADKPADGDGYKAEGMFKNCTETGKAVQQILENHPEDVKCGKK